MTAPSSTAGYAIPAVAAPPRLGFLGVGWIGRHRMEAIARAGAARIAALADPSPEMLSAAAAAAPGAERLGSLDELLDAGLDGLVIATPSALHAEQSIRALERGLAVFCQKPLGRTAAEARAVVEAARRADRLLGVDLSYRFAESLRRMRDLLSEGDIGDPYALDLVFHNAYGPDKPWFYDRRLSGGGCVIDLGTHLVDLALWMLGFPPVEGVTSRLFARGRPLGPGADPVEDYAVARLDVAGGPVVSIACSWKLHAGRDAVIEVTVNGTRGALRAHNVDGSFYDLAAERYRGTARETLVRPPDDWGGRAAAEWARRLAAGERFHPEAESAVRVAEVVDRIYSS